MTIRTVTTQITNMEITTTVTIGTITITIETIIIITIGKREIISKEEEEIENFTTIKIQGKVMSCRMLFLTNKHHHPLEYCINSKSHINIDRKTLHHTCPMKVVKLEQCSSVPSPLIGI
jgi:hypothetical protein